MPSKELDLGKKDLLKLISSVDSPAERFKLMRKSSPMWALHLEWTAHKMESFQDVKTPDLYIVSMEHGY